MLFTLFAFLVFANSLTKEHAKRYYKPLANVTAFSVAAHKYFKIPQNVLVHIYFVEIYINKY